MWLVKYALSKHGFNQSAWFGFTLILAGIFLGGNGGILPPWNYFPLESNEHALNRCIR